MQKHLKYSTRASQFLKDGLGPGALRCEVPGAPAKAKKVLQLGARKVHMGYTG